MIAVIADDFTGAAEIGGVGLQRGLKVLIETMVSGTGNPDLLVIVSDTRSMEVEKAKEKIKTLTSQLLKLKPRFIYKKLDSVLRGNIYEELISQQEVEGKKRVIVIPANPHFNRIIKDGIYYVEEVSLAETSFANDPEFPLTSSKVADIIGNDPSLINCLNVTEELPESGFIVGNVLSDTDLKNWAKRIDDQSVFGGGAGFFEAVLNLEFAPKIRRGSLQIADGQKALFIFGSTFPKTVEFITRLKTGGMAFINLSEEYFQDWGHRKGDIDEMAENIAGWLNQDRKVVVTTIFSDSPGVEISPELVRQEIGLLVKKVFQLAEINELYIEGGATASQIMRNLNISHLTPVRELDYGIIQMKVEAYPGLNLITKPGSYSWPDCVIPDSN
ncbi:four-carbon acid sugar kinase family protein [Mangrovibacterium sp.]|uniref:four-carbon acid sugar kinase family protein n=1 Tax=Mangrovibacterium sp. TaxID=1961364 RepID=UPI00356AFDAB